MDELTKRCQLVGDKGCTVYEDCPWACRMYPVGLASNADGEEFFFILKDRRCDGHGEPNQLTIREWIENQRTAEHDAANDEFRAISGSPVPHPRLRSRARASPNVLHGVLQSRPLSRVRLR